MTLEADQTPTRKTLLAGGLGGLIALIGGALGRPEDANAANDPQAVHKGVNNSTSAATSVTCGGATAIRPSRHRGAPTDRASSDPRPVLGTAESRASECSASSDRAAGRTDAGFTAWRRRPQGHPPASRVRAKRPNGFGVEGLNVATSGGAVGVFGKTNSPAGRSVRGLHAAATGVGAGVEGETSSSGGIGVFGHAEAPTGGAGVVGSASHAAAIGGSFQGTGGAVALQVAGPVQFTTSGIATITTAGASVTVSPGVDINATSKIL